MNSRWFSVLILAVRFEPGDGQGTGSARAAVVVASGCSTSALVCAGSVAGLGDHGRVRRSGRSATELRPR